MARRIEDIFDNCLERISQGDSIESCLKDYPEVAHELDVLLRTSLNVNWRSSLLKPRAEFKTRARAQFIRALTEQNLTSHYKAMQQRYVKRSSIFGLHRILAPALTALAVIIVIGGAGTATAAAATGTMPDEALYPVKLATEQVRLTLTFSNADKAILNAEIAETRSKEIQVMAGEGNTEQVILAAERMFINLENTALAVSRIVQAQENLAAFTPAAPATAPLPAPVTEPDVEKEPAPADQIAPSLAATPQPDIETEPVPPDETEGTAKPTTQATEQSPRDAGEEDSQKAGQLSYAAMLENAQLKKKLESSIDSNLSKLEYALKSAPENAKPYILNAIQITKDKRNKIYEDLPGNGNNEENQNSNKKTRFNRESTDNTTESPVSNNSNNDTANTAPVFDRDSRGNAKSDIFRK